MDELNLLSTQRPGLLTIDNFEQLKETLQGMMARYEGRTYGPETLALAQITEFIAAAQEANANNVLAALLDYKNARFADFDPMAEFTLEW